MGANVVNQIQPNRWHYYKMTYNAVDNQGVFFDLAYVNHIEGFDHEISREVNFLVSDESDNPFPTFANHAVASRLYWPTTEDFVDGTYVTTRQNVYLPASSFVAGRTYTLYTGLFAAPESTQVNHTYEFMATGIRKSNAGFAKYFALGSRCILTLIIRRVHLGHVHRTIRKWSHLGLFHD